MSYAYTNGDGVSVLDKTTPNGAAEPVSNLDDAIKQIKAWIRDTTSNVGAAGMQAAIAALQASSGVTVVGQGAFSARPTVPQNVVFGGAGTSGGVVTLGTESFDPDSVFSGSKFTVVNTGYYQFSACLQTETTGGSPTDLDIDGHITVNGNIAIGLNDTPGPDTTNGARITGSGLLYLSAGDYVELRYNFTTDAAVTVIIVETYTMLCGHRIR